jgi:hypothetical protein
MVVGVPSIPMDVDFYPTGDCWRSSWRGAACYGASATKPWWPAPTSGRARRAGRTLRPGPGVGSGRRCGARVLDVGVLPVCVLWGCSVGSGGALRGHRVYPER